ncbi:DNA polymerase III subunit beta [Paenibacillus aquistagni]|uniref:Beta sliding clamp n=1 Tax=Paenibacillus aquistagni TaxID=1852522 RepID=A0A1X7LYG4_9BACL|nr:DNA polymerase III subunit beta [Paenibacillus aquistagni]SMG58282.1 DNA polymerase III, beta subunit [Paenibacillus aquistagni]
MKCSANKHHLLKTLKCMSFPKAILNIDAIDKIYLISSDDTVITKSTIEAEVQDQGRVTVSCTILYDVLSKIRGDIIKLQTKDKKLYVIGESAKVSIATLDDTFTHEIEEPDQWFFTIPASVMRKAIKKTNHAIQYEKVPDAIKGLHICASGNQLTFTGTDKKQFAMFRIELPSDEQFEAILPKEHLKWVEGILDVGEVSFSIKDNYGVFATDTHILYTRTLNGNYPAVLKLLDKQTVCTVKVDSNELLKSVELATITADKSNTKGAKEVFLSTKVDGIGIAARNELGDVTDILHAETDGQELKVVYDSTHLIHAIKAASTDKTELGFLGADSPLVINGEDCKFMIGAIKNREV